MDYSTFDRLQLETALTSLKLENANHLNTIQKLKKELKDLKGRCSSFEGDSLDRKSVARRFNIN